MADSYINYKCKWLRVGFAFFDLADAPMCDKIMAEKGIKHAKFSDMGKEGVPYRLVMCSVLKKDAEAMRGCINDLENKMLLTGHTDYVKEWENFVSNFEHEFGKK